MHGIKRREFMKTALSTAAVLGLGSYSRADAPPQIGPESVDPSKSFSFVGIPDTHVDFLCSGGRLEQMSQWIANKKERLNISFVAHLGDAGDRRGVGTILEMLRLTRSSMQPIINAGLPLSTCIGNHDFDTSSSLRASAAWLAANSFGMDLYEDMPGFGGTFEQESDSPGVNPGGTANHYITVNAAGLDLLLLNLELGAREKVMEWADDLVLNRYPDNHVFVFTHSYLHTDGTRVRPGTSFNPKGYSGFSTAPGPENTLDGEDMWQRHLRRWPNLRMVHSGHAISGPRQAYQVSTGDAGNRVAEWFYNWQEWGYNAQEGRMVHGLSAPHVASMIKVFNVDIEAGKIRNWNYMPTAGVVGEEPVAHETDWADAGFRALMIQ